MNSWNLHIFLNIHMHNMTSDAINVNLFLMDPHFVYTKSDDITFPKSMLLRCDLRSRHIVTTKKMTRH